jgi:hypothetical protein
MDNTEKATKHLPLPRGFTNRAVAIGDAMLAQPIYVQYDHFGVTCLFLASKEVNAMKSVHLLVAGVGRHSPRRPVSGPRE